MPDAEFTHLLATEGDAKNHRNGKSRKTVLAPGGELEIPRDRLSNFEPKLVAKHQRRMSRCHEPVPGLLFGQLG